MLRMSKKKVKTVYALMYVFFVAAIVSIIFTEPIDEILSIVLFVGFFGIAYYCNWWLRDQFKCPNCTNCLLKSRPHSRNGLVIDPLNQYDKFCSVCGKEIKIEFTD